MLLLNLAAALGSRITLLDLKVIPDANTDPKAVRLHRDVGDPAPAQPAHEYHLKLALVDMNEDIRRERRAEIDLDHKMYDLVSGKLIERSAPTATYDEDGLFAYWTIICVYRFYGSQADLPPPPPPPPPPEPRLSIFNTLREREDYYDDDGDDPYYDYDDPDGWEWTPDADAIQPGPYLPSYTTGIRSDQLL